MTLLPDRVRDSLCVSNGFILVGVPRTGNCAEWRVRGRLVSEPSNRSERHPTPRALVQGLPPRESSLRPVRHGCRLTDPLAQARVTPCGVSLEAQGATRRPGNGHSAAHRGRAGLGPERQARPVRGPDLQLALLRDRRSRRPQQSLCRRGDGDDSPGQERGHPGHPLPGHQQRRVQGIGMLLQRLRPLLDGTRARLRDERPLLRLLHTGSDGHRGVRPAHRGVPALGRQPRCRRSRQRANRARDSAREPSERGPDRRPQRRPAAVRTRRPPLHLRRRR